jgi:uncharacterized membrane-anchored protein
MRSAIAVVACVVALALVNWTILRRERHLHDGRVVYLELAPVDPRSLMQGDYMALRFAAAAAIDTDRDGGGYLVVHLDDRSVATFARLDDGTLLAPGEIRLRYRVRAGSPKFATNAFFFQEGDADLYESAQYGEFRVDEDGELLLTGLRGRELERLGPS